MGAGSTINVGLPEQMAVGPDDKSHEWANFGRRRIQEAALKDGTATHHRSCGLRQGGKECTC